MIFALIIEQSLKSIIHFVVTNIFLQMQNLLRIMNKAKYTIHFPICIVYHILFTIQHEKDIINIWCTIHIAQHVVFHVGYR